MVSFSSIMLVRFVISSLCLVISCWFSWFVFDGCGWGWLVSVVCSLFISSSLFVSLSIALLSCSDTDWSFSWVSLSWVLSWGRLLGVCGFWVRSSSFQLFLVHPVFVVLFLLSIFQVPFPVLLFVFLLFVVGPRSTVVAVVVIFC